MKNKKTLSVLLFIFFVSFANSLFSEEIIFETPEIQSLNNNQLIKADKGGKAIINKNSEVIADKFEYDKKNEILTAVGNVVLNDNLNNIITKSNKIIYEKNLDKYFSKGKTNITIEKKYIINSKDVNLLIKENQLFSDRNTTVEDNENNFYTTEKFRYLIGKKLFRGSRVFLNANNNDKYYFEDVLINLETKELHGKDIEVNFDNSTFGNKKNEPRLKGNKIYSNENTTTVSKGVFTTCKRRKDKKCPPWIIEAKEAKHDKIKKTIYYKNAWLKIYNVPVLYYPYFFHPDPTVKRQSGFLTPQIGDSQLLGSSTYIPYFYVISDREDLTFKPRFFTDNKNTLQAEYRRANRKSSHILDVSLTEGYDSSSADKNNTRSHFFSNSIIELDFPSFDVSNLEIQVQKTSNNTYLKLFNLESPLFGESLSSKSISTLNSFINLTANREDLDVEANIEVYEKLGSPNSDRYEFILPSYNLSKNIKTKDYAKGTLSFNSSGSQHLYNTNVKETQIINDLLYSSENIFSNNGLKNNYKLLIKNVNSDGENSATYKNKLNSELLSSLIFETSYPLLREGINFDDNLTPKISLRYSPNSMKNLKDSKTRVDIKNIFSLERLGVSNTVESGQSLTIGAEYKKSRNDEDNNTLPQDVLELSLATVFRDKINEKIPTSSSIGNKSSDIVGSVEINPSNFLSTSYNFSVDNNINQLKYNDLTAKFTVNNFVTSFKYIEESDNIGDEHYWQNDTTFNFNENSSISYSTRRNKKIDLTEFYDLIYQYKNDCLTAAIEYNKEYYSDGDLKPTEQLFFSLTIVPLGSYETKNILPTN